MFVPFSREDNILNEKPFLSYEVQFNLFYKIIEGKDVIALKTKDNNAIALQNPGFAMWLWINEGLDKASVDNIINSLCYELEEDKLFKISGKPEYVKSFAKKYSKLLDGDYRLALSMETYQCKKVIKPENVQGRMIRAKSCHADIIAEYCAGFVLDCFGAVVSKKSQIPGAEAMINAGNLFLWQVNGEIVSMASVAHRSKRYARINNVYTPTLQRKKGFASALTAELSSMVMEEGLIPMLYADIKNPDSNKVYKSVGYKECGRIDDYAFKYI